MPHYRAAIYGKPVFVFPDLSGQRLRNLLGALFLAAMGTSVGLGQGPAPTNHGGRSTVNALARLEPADGMIAVGVAGARIESIVVKAGDAVQAGQLLATLEGVNQRKLQLELATAQKGAADFDREIKKQELILSRRQFDLLQKNRITSQTELVTILENSLTLAQADLERLTQAQVAKQQINQQQLFLNTTRGNLIEAKLRLFELDLANKILPEQRALEDRRLQDDTPHQKVLKDQIELAKAELEQTQVKAPGAGEVLQVLSHAGEVVSGPFLYLGDMRKMVANAEVYQKDVGSVQVGDAASIDIFGTRVTGKVERVGKMVGRNKMTSINPISPTDRRVVEVRILLDDATLAARYVNMEVDATIVPGGEKSKQ